MNKQVFLIVLILLLACCKNKKNEFVFNIFDPTEISDFTYEYENGKIISETTLQSVFILGSVVDKNIFRSFYKYNDKGLLEQKTTYFNENSNPNLDIYIYNSNDLLIKEFGIMGRDTVTWYEYDYFP
ncbi:MAG: hypothetical protein LBI65_03825, partial [Candidatus Symbiothrix sp.]|nr:hypothetical protein [Candidatus Symbiothrix sp.]